MGTSGGTLGKRGAFTAVFFAAIACAVNQFKVPPVIGDVQTRFGMTLFGAGWVSSAYALSVLALAIPSAMLINKLGTRKAAVLGICISCGASALGAIAPSAGVFVALRVVEGIGQALVFVIGPSLISQLFAEDERGLALGIFNCAIPIAVVFAYNSAVPLRDAFGMSSIWVATALMLAVAAALTWTLVPEEGADAATAKQNERQSGWSAWTNVGIVLCCLTMCGSGFRDLAYTTWSPSYYSSELGLSEAAANFGTSVEYIGLVLGSVGTGLIADRLAGNRPLAIVLVVVEALTCLASFVGFSLSSGAVIAYMGALGVLVGANVTLLYALVGRVARRLDEVSMGAAMMTAFLSVGQLLGPPVSGFLVEGGSWHAATIATVGASLLMVACATLVMRLSSR